MLGSVENHFLGESKPAMAPVHTAAIPITNGPGDAAGAVLPSPPAGVGEAADEIAARVLGFLPAARRFVSRAAYHSCYYTSYGVTFSTVLLVNMIPGCLP